MLNITALRKAAKSQKEEFGSEWTKAHDDLARDVVKDFDGDNITPKQACRVVRWMVTNGVDTVSDARKQLGLGNRPDFALVDLIEKARSDKAMATMSNRDSEDTGFIPSLEILRDAAEIQGNERIVVLITQNLELPREHIMVDGLDVPWLSMARASKVRTHALKTLGFTQTSEAIEFVAEHGAVTVTEEVMAEVLKSEVETEIEGERF